MQNAQNAFGLSSQAQSFLWQEMRDRANYDWQSAENFENRKTQVIAQALANEGDLAKVWSTVSSANWTSLLGSMFTNTAG
jgi:SRSO17 transposase